MTHCIHAADNRSGSNSIPQNQAVANVLRFAALALAQRIRAAAAILARVAGLNFRLPAGAFPEAFAEAFAAAGAPFRYLAQRNLCAAAILALALGLIFLRPP